MPHQLKYRMYIGVAVIALILISVISSFAETINYSYDAMNRLIRTDYVNGPVVNYTYDNLGNRYTKTTIPAGATLNAPTGGEVWAGTHNILWTATDPEQPGAGALSATLYYGSSATGPWTQIATGLACTSNVQASYVWNTAQVQDGVYWIRLVVSDDIGICGEAISNSSIMIDNTSPAAPIVNSPTHPNQNVWYSNNSPVLNWTSTDNLSGITGYSYLLNQVSTTIPSTINQGITTVANYSGKADADWYFHVRAVDGAGNWGNTSHYAVHINTGSAWRYHWPITIINSNSLVTQYQVGEIKLQWNHIGSANYIGSIAQPGSSLFSNTGADMRFTDSDGQTLIPFWRRSWNNKDVNNNDTKISSVWVKVPQLPANGIKIIYLWGGNKAVMENLTLNSYSRTMTKITDTTVNSCKALWHMDGGSGDTVVDSSGNGYNGTRLGTTKPVWQSTDGGQWDRINKQFNAGSHLSFNGSQSYVSMGDVCDMGTANFTIEAWVKITSTGIMDVVNKMDKSGNYPGYSLNIGGPGSGKVRGRIKIGTSGITFDSSGTVNNNAWHHIVAVFDRGAYGTIYIDGAQNGTPVNISSLSANLGTSGNLEIGRSDTNYFNGYVDEIAIYNSALSSNQIRAHYRRHKYAGAQAVSCALGGVNAPATPVNVSPANGAYGVSVPPTLIASAFHSTEGDIHQQTQWQIRAANGSYDSPVYSPIVTDTSMTTQSSCVIPSNKLMGGNAAYYWRVRYKGSRGEGWSAYSDETSFITTSAISGWPYRWPIAVINGNNTVLSNFQVGEIMLQWISSHTPNYIGLSASATPLFSSYTMRFTDSDGVTPIPFWRRSWNNKDVNNNDTKISSVWVKVPQLPANGIKTIYLWGSNKVITADTPLNSYSLTMTKLTDTTANSCVALWHMDEGTGQINDSSGNGYNSTTNTASWLTSDGGQWSSLYRKFSSGSQLKFNGITSCVVVPDNPPLETSGEKTVLLWANPANTTANKTAISKFRDTTAEDGWAINFTSTGGIKGWIKNSIQTTFITSYASYQANTWYHVAMTWNTAGGKVRLYVNGTFIGSSSTISGNFSGNPRNLHIGRNLNSSNATITPFNGKIDEVAIYNRILSLAEIQAHYYRRKYEGLIPVYILGELNTPNTPANISPANGATGVSVTPTLIASAFHGTWGDIHKETQWQIRAANGNYDLPVYDVIVSGTYITTLSSHTVSSHILRGGNTLYFWRVRYKGFAGWSFYSDETSFITTSAIINWPYKWPITITNNNMVLTNFQIGEINLQWNNSISSNYIGSLTSQGTPLFSSYAMRFTDSDGMTPIPFWRRSWHTTGINSGISSVWVKVPQILANSSIKTIYLWGSDMQALDASNYSQTMTKITDTTANGCAALWHMDEGSGISSIYDASGNGNTGTLVNNPVWQTVDGGPWPGTPGPIFDNGSNLYFNGSYVRIPGSSSLGISNTMTVLFWLNYNTTSIGQTIIWNKPGNWGDTNGFYIEVQPQSNKNRIVAVSSGTVFATGTLPVPNTWQAIAIVFNGSTCTIYKNGANITNSSTINPLVSSTSDIYLAGAFDGGNIARLAGYLDEVAIYNHVLSADEIQAHYKRSKYANPKPTWAIVPRQ